MTNFKEQDGMLFKMLEEPVPLRENDENVLVRFITHGVIGEYVIEHWLDCNQKNVPIYVEGVDSDGDVTVWIENGNEHHCCPFPMFEIIGTPVAEGSDKWALYQMMQGKKVFNSNRRSFFHYFEIKNGWIAGQPEGFINLNSKRPDEWIEWVGAKSGWEIYKEPKPLLAKAKVGDLCQRRDGKWVQIDRLLSIGGMPWICYEIGGLRYINNGEQLNSKLSELGIISTEPLATEGTKEWALQMMNLGKCVCHVKAPSIKYHKPTHYVKRVVRENCTDDMYDAVWMEGADPTDWKLYEPKQKPEPDKEDMHLRSGKDNPERQDFIKPDEPQPEPQYKVGDWVEYRLHANTAASDNNMMGQIIDIGRIGGTSIEVLPVGNYEHNSSLSTYHVIYASRIIRKLKPSEVIVNIGCLSGTVEDLSYEENGKFWLIGKATERHPIDMYVLLYDEMLDTPTSNLVESLLKAQEEAQE